MHDISNSGEARKLLEKADFSIDDARAVLLYLTQRDERWKQNAEKINAAFMALFQVAAGVMGSFAELASRGHIALTSELKLQLEETAKAIHDLRELLDDDLSVH